MFPKSFLAPAVLLALSLALHANAHAGVSPALGVTGNLTRNDVQRPSTAAPCGSVDIANAIDASTAVPVAADGSFTATVVNFNAGADGSRSVSMKIDATGVGKTFAAGSVTTNGDATPTDVGPQQIVAALPPGTKCTGGKTKNLCLASFTTTSGFGNCVVLQQDGAGAAAPSAAPSSSSSSTTSTTSATATTTPSDSPAAQTPPCAQNGAVGAVATPVPSNTSAPAAGSGYNNTSTTTSATATTSPSDAPAAQTPPCAQNGAVGAVATPAPSPPSNANTTAPAAGSGYTNASSSANTSTSSTKKKPCHKKKNAKASAGGTRAARAARAEDMAME